MRMEYAGIERQDFLSPVLFRESIAVSGERLRYSVKEKGKRRVKSFRHVILVRER